MPDIPLPALSFEEAAKDYGEIRALHPLTLSVPAGGIASLVGPNGAGKTTALGLVAGLLAPSAGRVLVFGIDPEVDPVGAKRRLALVPDRPWLWPRWTPRETLRFVGAVHGMRLEPLEERIRSELLAFGIDGAADRRNETLSHGTRQKVALAQAFLHDPGLFLLDEPMVGLDPSAQRLLVRRLRERAASGAAVLLTTHQLSLAEEAADVVFVLSGGRLAGAGDPRAMTDPSTGRKGRLSDLFFDLVPSEAPRE